MNKTRGLIGFLLLALLLGGCGLAGEPGTTPPPPPTQPQQPYTPLPVPDTSPVPTESPWYLGTPSPLVAPLVAECPAEGAFPPKLDEVYFGINAFLFSTDTERVLSLVETGGFNWIRQQIHWRDMEGEQGNFVWRPLDQLVSATRARDMHLFLSIVRSPPWVNADGNDGLPEDPEAFATFMFKLASRYKGRVTAYQIWNEPNLAHEGGGVPEDPADYLATLQAGYRAVKQADPCALVVSAALAATHNPDPAVAREDLPYLEELYQLEDGAFLEAADIVGVHTGAGNYAPTDEWEDPEESHFYFRHIERTRELMERYNDPRQVWLTEYGWTVLEAQGAPPPVSEQQQATYLVDALWRIRQSYPWVSGIFVWNLNFSVISPPGDEKNTYSVLNPDWSIRPSFLALQHDVPALRDANRTLRLPEAAPYTHAWSFPGRGRMHHALLQAPAGLDGADGADGAGTLYTPSLPGTLYAVRPDGALEWVFYAPGTLTGTPAQSPDGMLYVSDTGGMLTALQPDGSVAWAVRLPAPARGSPVYSPFAGGRIAVVTSAGEIHVFNRAGEESWQHALGSDSTPPGLANDGSLLVGAAEGELLKFTADGDLEWQTTLAGEFWARPVAALSNARDGGSYVVTVTGRVFALDAGGAVRWQTEIGAPVQTVPLVGRNGNLYLVDQAGGLTALEASDGAVAWRSPTGSPLAAPPAQGADGTLYLGTGDERLLAISENGELRWEIAMRGEVRAPPLVGADGGLYVPTSAGRLYALAPR